MGHMKARTHRQPYEATVARQDKQQVWQKGSGTEAQTVHSPAF